MKTLKTQVKSSKTINEHISGQKHYQATNAAKFFIVRDSIGQFFQPVGLYVIYLFCIFININENFSNKRKKT